MNKQYLALSALLTTIALTGFGCGSVTSNITNKITEKVAEKATESMIESQSGGKVDLDINKGEVNYKAEDGTSVSYGSDLKLPSDFPTAIPIYASTKIIATSSTPTDSTVTMTSTDKADVILSWYESQLSAWKKEQSFDSDGYSMRVFKKDNTTLTLAIGNSDDTRSITVHYVTEAAATTNTNSEQTPS